MSFNDAAFVAIHFWYMSIDEVIKLSTTLIYEKKGDVKIKKYSSSRPYIKMIKEVMTFGDNEIQN